MIPDSVSCTPWCGPTTLAPTNSPPVGMRPQAVSNQLQRLSDLGVLASRRDGNNIHYRLVDLCVRSLLDRGLVPHGRSERSEPWSDKDVLRVTGSAPAISTNN